MTRNENESSATFVVERVQTGVRIEKRILKVLKALAEYLDMTLGDLLEGIVLHAFEGKAPFIPDTLAKHRPAQGGLRPRPRRHREPPADRVVGSGSL